ncbi:Recombinase [Desulfosporosinus metallidurans]|uniref:Recombinase n=2 Tax=Desulfosporosinus metallidurans TaxID=1888891 RepID=A0A1Q8R2K0_9FIRM|nr:Recombinase [Desulfosporosinus metallidurans]
MINVVAYVRSNSDNQWDKSIDTQVRAIKEYAEKENLNIIEIYIDRAISAMDDNRTDFQRMIENSKLKTFEQVIVHKLDRFSRNRYDFDQYEQTLKKNGVDVRSVLESLDDSPESIIIT